MKQVTLKKLDLVRAVYGHFSYGPKKIPVGHYIDSMEFVSTGDDIVARVFFLPLKSFIAHPEHWGVKKRKTRRRIK